VHQRGLRAAYETIGLVKNAELPQHRGAVVVNPLACEPILRIELEDAAQRKCERAPRRREATPGAEMMSANDGFEDRCTSILKSGIALGSS